MNTPAPRPGIQRLVLGPCTGTPESPEPSLQAAPYISSTPLLQNSITVCEYGKSFTCILFIHLFIRHIHSHMDMCMYNILICMYIYIYIYICEWAVTQCLCLHWSLSMVVFVLNSRTPRQRQRPLFPSMWERWIS